MSENKLIRTREQRRYDETFKRHAVELTLRGDRLMREIAQEIGVTEWTLSRWRQRYAPKPSGGGGGAAMAPELTEAQKDEEIQWLRAEVTRLREREIILKKSLGILSETPGSGMPASSR